MEANAPKNNKRKAPDKIYACFGVFGMIQATEIRATSKDIEYIRKDAFIEKAAKWIKDKAESYIVETSLFSYFDYKRAVEDFKEAMKL